MFRSRRPCADGYTMGHTLGNHPDWLGDGEGAPNDELRYNLVGTPHIAGFRYENDGNLE